MQLNNQNLKQLREDYIKAIMQNDTLCYRNNSEVLVHTEGANEDYVQLIKTGGFYRVVSSWRIEGHFNDLGNAKRLYENLVKELLAEF